MADLGNFTRAKDWAIVVLVGLVFSLLGAVAHENRQRILDNEARVVALEAESREAERRASANTERLARVEESLGSMRGDIVRRLDRIEDRLGRQ